MKIPGHEECFVCGRDSEIALDFFTEGGRVSAVFSLTKKFQSFRGIVHGGVLASILAEAMGAAVSLFESEFLGKRICVEYYAPVRPEVKYRVHGEVIRREGRKIFARAEIYDADNNLCASAEGLFIALR